MLKKGDFIIILSVLLLALASSALVLSPKSGKTVTVKENNKTVYSGSLYENKTVKLAGNTVEIKNGKVRVSSADCKNQICVNHKPISKRQMQFASPNFMPGAIKESENRLSIYPKIRARHVKIPYSVILFAIFTPPLLRPYSASILCFRPFCL